MKKSAIIISILITTLVLGTVAGVVKAVSVSQTNAKVQELEQTIQAREELYKQTIEEANTRLAQVQTNPNSFSNQPGSGDSKCQDRSWKFWVDDVESTRTGQLQWIDSI